jgi:chemotaxis protein histidine kinase CheA
MSSGQAGHLSGRVGRGGRTKRIGIDVIVGLLETLDGRASVETDAERGSKVTISIPLEPLHA